MTPTPCSKLGSNNVCSNAAYILYNLVLPVAASVLYVISLQTKLHVNKMSTRWLAALARHCGNASGNAGGPGPACGGSDPQARNPPCIHMQGKQSRFPNQIGGLLRGPLGSGTRAEQTHLQFILTSPAVGFIPVNLLGTSAHRREPADAGLHLSRTALPV